MKPTIKVTGLSKSYSISHNLKSEYSTIKDSFDNFIKKPFHRNKKESHETFWALKDVSFEVNKGEIFGIVGRNGSGKSTLLKILSRTVQPTKGEVVMQGRVASLLEVGTGFHPELTGRENVFFNGSMLGMSRREILKKFDEIVAFSEIEKFIDTPVKFYSSGMYVRLAFSVAAHLNPDILILDEVLAVGDANFQKKSLAKIKSIMADNGTTVIFVSHSMSAVQELCSNGILLDKGIVSFKGNTEELTLKYLDTVNKTGTEENLKVDWINTDKEDNEYFSAQSLYISDKDNKKYEKTLSPKDDYFINIKIDIHKLDKGLNIGYCLRNKQTKAVVYMSLTTDVAKEDWPKLTIGTQTIQSKLPIDIMNGGDYMLSLISSIHNKKWLYDPDEKTPSLDFKLDEWLHKSPYWIGTRLGYIAPTLEWKIKKDLKL